MTITRRSVITGAAAAGAALTLSEVRVAAAPTPAVRTRYNATTPQGKAMLVKYGQAVTKMKALPKADPLNWDFQWYTHWIPGADAWQPSQPIKAQMINTVFAGTPPNDPHRLLAKAMWDTCQAHANNPNDPNDFQQLFFLPWHRFFVYYFEEIIRKVLNDDTFTLPYWNYLTSTANDRIMPPEFRDPQNPLFVQNRNAWVNAGKRIDSDPSVTPINNQCFRESKYIRFCGAIDANPHGAVHVDVGTETNMGDVPTAAQDPIFWVHHCEIDRLWESWNRVAAHKNPVWPDRSFVYADANGNSVIRKCKDADRVALLGYQYDNYYISPFAPARLPAAAPAAALAAAASVQETTRAVANGPLQLSPGGSRITMQPPPALALPNANGVEAAAALKPLFQVAPGQQLYLVLGNIQIPNKIATGVNIYLDLPEGQKGQGPSDVHYVDTLNFFGIHVREPNGSHAADHQRTFNVTEVVKALQAKGLLTPTPTVTAEPAGELGGGVPVIGRVSLVAG
jgi:tyrosinase